MGRGNEWGIRRDGEASIGRGGEKIEARKLRQLFKGIVPLLVSLLDHSGAPTPAATHLYAASLRPISLWSWDMCLQTEQLSRISSRLSGVS